MCKVCARSSPLRSTLNTSYIRFGHVSSMYRSSPLRSTLNTIVITHHSKSYIFPSKSKDLSPPAGSALFVRSTKTAGPRVFTMCQNIENHTDICKPWANYLSTGAGFQPSTVPSPISFFNAAQSIHNNTHTEVDDKHVGKNHVDLAVDVFKIAKSRALEWSELSNSCPNMKRRATDRGE